MKMFSDGDGMRQQEDYVGTTWGKELLEANLNSNLGKYSTLINPHHWLLSSSLIAIPANLTLPRVIGDTWRLWDKTKEVDMLSLDFHHGHMSLLDDGRYLINSCMWPACHKSLDAETCQNAGVVPFKSEGSKQSVRIAYIAFDMYDLYCHRFREKASAKSFRRWASSMVWHEARSGSRCKISARHDQQDSHESLRSHPYIAFNVLQASWALQSHTIIVFASYAVRYQAEEDLGKGSEGTIANHIPATSTLLTWARQEKKGGSVKLLDQSLSHLLCTGKGAAIWCDNDCLQRSANLDSDLPFAMREFKICNMLLLRMTWTQRCTTWRLQVHAYCIIIATQHLKQSCDAEPTTCLQLLSHCIMRTELQEDIGQSWAWYAPITDFNPSFQWLTGYGSQGLPKPLLWKTCSLQALQYLPILRL